MPDQRICTCLAIRVIRSASVLFLLSACVASRDLVAPDSIDLDFVVGNFDELATEPPTIEGDVGRIVVRGIVRTSQCGWTWDATLDSRTQGYVLTVTGTPGGGVTIPCAYGYRATLTQLPPGSYVIEVHHHDNDQPVTEESVTVN